MRYAWTGIFEIRWELELARLAQRSETGRESGMRMSVLAQDVEAIQQHCPLSVLYECESWKGLKQVEEMVRIFESGFLRKIMKIRWF